MCIKALSSRVVEGWTEAADTVIHNSRPDVDLCLSRTYLRSVGGTLRTFRGRERQNMTVLRVNTEQYAGAAFEAAAVGRRLQDAVTAAALRMASSGSMAGWDSTGVAWAASYDPAASGVFRTLGDLVDQTGLGVDAVNLASLRYVHTEYAASLGTSSLGHSWAHLEPFQRMLPPSAHGGVHSPTPELWDLVANTTAMVWPTGDTAKLRETSAAWQRLAAELEHAETGFNAAIQLVDGLHSRDIELLRGRHSECAVSCRELADGARQMETACADFARHIDDAHRDLGAETAQFALDSAAIAGIGGAITFLTGGVLAPAAAAALSARFAALAVRLAMITARLSAASAALIQRVQPLAGITARLSGTLQRLNPSVSAVGRRLAPAVVIADKAVKSTAFKLVVDGPSKAAGELIVKQAINRLPARAMVVAKFDLVEQAAHVVKNTAGTRSTLGRFAAAGSIAYDRLDNVGKLGRPHETFWAQPTSDPANNPALKPVAALPVRAGAPESRASVPRAQSSQGRQTGDPRASP